MGLVSQVRIARAGDHQAGQQVVVQICERLPRANDLTTVELGSALLRLLGDAAPDETLASPPPDLRRQIEEALRDDV